MTKSELVEWWHSAWLGELWANWWWALPAGWALFIGYCRLKTGSEKTGQIDLRSYLTLLLFLQLLISGQLAAIIVELRSE